MSFAISGTLITQTGTDTDLSGLSGISGVTVLNYGDVSIYQMSGVQLLINGTLSIDPKTERLFFLDDQPSTYAVRLDASGTLTIGTDANAPSYSEGLWLQTTRKATTGYNGNQLSLDVRGTLILYGGTMDVSAMVSMKPTSLICEGQRVFLRATNNQNARFKTDNSVLYENFYLYENGIQVGGGTTGAPTFNNIIIDNGITIGVNPCFDGQIIENFDYIKKGSIYPWNSASTSANKTVTSRNHAKGTSGGTNTFEFGSPTTQSQLVIVCTRHLDFNVKTTSGSNLQGVKISTIERDNSGTNYPDWPFENDNRNLTLAGTDYSTPLATNVTTSANGDASIDDFRFAIAFQYNNGSRTRILSRFTKSADSTDTHDFYYFKYGYLIGSTDIGLAGKDRLQANLLMVTDLSITETNKSIVDAYSEIDTPQKFYDRASSYLEDNYARQASALVSRAGIDIDAGSFNIEVDASASSAFAFDGSKITIKSSAYSGNLTTSGLVTLANGAVVLGTITDANGSRATLQYSISGLIQHSRVQIYNVTTAAEIFNGSVNATTYSAQYTEGAEVTAGDEIRLRVTRQNGVTAYLPFTATAIATASGFSLKASQEADAVYNANAIDGSLVSTLTADFPNVQVDVDDADGLCDVREIYARYVNIITTEEGIRQWFSGITAINTVNYRVNTSIANLTIQNVGSNAVNLGVARIYRDDGAIILAPGNAPITQDNGEFVQFIQPQVEAALTPITNSTDQIPAIKKNTNLIPALL